MPAAHAQDSEPDTLIVREWPSRTDTLRVVGSGPFLLRPNLVSGSVRITVNGYRVVDPDVHIDHRFGQIRLPGVAPDSVVVISAAYKYIPVQSPRTYSLWGRDEEGIEEEGNEADSGRDRDVDAPTPVQQQLQTTGQVSRGILAGSGQDAAIESGLQLQVRGEVAPGVQLEARLNDEDTPLVPEGVTRRLDQFDQVYIGLTSDLGRVELGDLEAQLSNSRFGNLDRRLQGAMFSTSERTVGNGAIRRLRATAGTAVTRGSYLEQVIQIEEASQGPYRLEGEAGERFILILPGTERVYLDGQLLTRGLDADYTIDYTTAEIRFTSRRVMSPDMRVRVGFEYTTNRFTRTLSFASVSGEAGGTSQKPWVSWGMRAIQERDGDAFGDEIGLSAADSALVAQSADGQVQGSGAIEVLYDPEALYVQYTRTQIDDGEGGQRDVYTAVSSVPPAGARVFRVSFSWVGEGNGSYSRSPGLSGSVEYRYVGSGNGSYEPVRTLTAPMNKQLVGLSLGLHRLPGVIISGEGAVSVFDPNRLSALGDGARQRTAGSMDVHTVPLALGSSWAVTAAAKAEWREASFATFSRTRDIEFSREWNLPFVERDAFSTLLPLENEQERALALTFTGQDSVGTSIERMDLKLGDQWQADRWQSRSRYRFRKQLQWDSRIQQATSRIPGMDQRDQWRHLINRVTWSSRLNPWLEWERERFDGQVLELAVEQSSTSRNLLTPRISYDEWTFGAAFPHTSGSWNALIEVRSEQDDGDATTQEVNATTGQVGWRLNPSPSLQAEAGVGARVSRLQGVGNQDDSPVERSLLLNSNGTWSLPSNARISWRYDARSERRATLQEIYIRTGAERGTHVWEDVNGDGIIQVDEFLPETLPGEGDYAQTFFPTDSLESVTTVDASLRFDTDPVRTGQRWRQIRTRSAIEIQETTRSDERTRVYLLNPSALRQAGQTVRGRIRMTHDLDVLPLTPDRTVFMRWAQGAALSQLSTGNQTTKNQELLGRLGSTWSERWRTDLDIRREVVDSRSEGFTSRTFDIARWEIEPKVTWASSWIRVTGSVVAGRAHDRSDGVRSRMIRLPLAVRSNTARRLDWNASVEHARFNTDGTLRGLQLIEMTQGRGDGASWLWRAQMTYQVTDIVQASLRYDARAPEGADVIHTGRVQVSARF